jgi:hypothetical protein
MGLTKRRLCKPERKPARKKGVLEKHAPIGCLSANKAEIALAVYSLCEDAGYVVGRGGDYDPLRDQYTVVGKHKETGKVQDITVEGAEVATLIKLVRRLNGGRLQKAG